MSAGKFCPVCGAKADRYYEGLCEECYKKAHPLAEIPRRITVTVCRVCGAVLHNRKWVMSENALDMFLEKSISKHVKAGGNIKEVRVERRGLSFRVTVKGYAAEGMSPYEEQYSGRLAIRKSLCDDCRASKGRVEVANVQIRAQGRGLGAGEIRSLTEAIDRFLKGDSRSLLNLLEISEEPGGIDVKFSSALTAKKVVSKLSKEFPVDVLKTYKTVGYDRDGKRKVKTTFRVLLPAFEPGDLIEVEGKLYYVVDVIRGSVKLLDVNDFREVHMKPSDTRVFKARVVVREDELEPAMIVALTAGELQVMSLVDYRVYSFAIKGACPWMREGGSVLIARLKEGMYVVPSRSPQRS